MKHYKVVIHRQTGNIQIYKNEQYEIEDIFALFLSKITKDLQSGVLNGNYINMGD